jgi:hypothetical protein
VNFKNRFGFFMGQIFGASKSDWIFAFRRLARGVKFEDRPCKNTLCWA